MCDEKLNRRGEFDDYKSMDDVLAYATKVEKRMQAYLSDLTPNGLAKKYHLTDDRNQEVDVTTEDILIHVFEEEVHHRGEFIALLWQMNIEPPLMGWKYL